MPNQKAAIAESIHFKLIFSQFEAFCGLISWIQSNQTFHYSHCVTQTRVMSWRVQSLRHCARATQLHSRKNRSSGDLLTAPCQIQPARDLNLRLPASEMNALSLDQLAVCLILSHQKKTKSVAVIIIFILSANHNCNSNYILLTKLSRQGDSKETFRSLSQAATCSPVYHSCWRDTLSLLMLNVKQGSCEYQFS